MIVLVDTDVLIDVALEREGHVEAAAALLDCLEQHPGVGFVAWHSVSNFYYLVAPVRGRSDTKDFVVDLTRFIEVAPTTTDHIRRAAQLRMPDFEDALQAAAAIACAADVVATRNVREYANSPVPANTPTQVVRALVESRP